MRQAAQSKGMGNQHMSTKEIVERTGLAERTVHKYAVLLDIPYLGTGRRKTYLWTEADVPRLKEAMHAARVGRPPRKEPSTE